MADIIREIANTPLPTVFILIGLLMISVGFGLKFKAAIDVERLNPLFAKIAGISLLVLGLIPNFIQDFMPGGVLPTTRDPFIAYYVVCVLIVVIVCWLTLKYTHDQVQLRLIRSTFALIGVLLTITVFWRAMDVYFYLKVPDIANVPLGLYGQSNFLPYFALLGAGVLLVAWIVFYYTRKDSDNANRLPIFGYFAWFCIYLIVCRFGWEIVDYVAKGSIPTPPT